MRPGAVAPRRRTLAALVSAAALLGCLPAAAATGQAEQHAAAPVATSTGGPVTGPVHRAGRWLVDSQGRVVTFHGVNVLKKVAPYVRTGFTDADARLLAAEGFTAVRTGFIWEAVEPRPGRYDDRYIDRVLRLDTLLARHGIRTLVDVHQDTWGRSTGGDGAPAWATLASPWDAAFAAFWRDDKAPDGVGIQTHFVRMWHHLAERLKGHPNIVGLDPFNEPYAGTDYPCVDFTPCPSFESGALASFYRRVITAIRSTGARQVIFPEAIADSGDLTPSLPTFADPQTAYTFHYYCNATQTDSRDVPLGQPAPEATVCEPLEQRNLGIYHDYLATHRLPGFLGEFSCSDVQQDNAQVVDLADAAFDSWTVWAYYTAADDPADCPRQGLLVDDARGGSEGNAKQDKLAALAVPYATAIAGTPASTGLDRSSRSFTLSWSSHAVPGARLARGALTEVFVPARTYPTGYVVAVTGGRVVSRPGARWLLVAASPGATSVSLRVRPTGGR